MNSEADFTEISIDKTSAIPLHVQIESLLRNLIKGGYFEKLEKPITEKFLQDQLNVSRNTVRQAVSKIVDEGLIIRKRAQGISLVKNASRIMGESITGLSFTEAAIKRGQMPTIKILDSHIGRPPERISSVLFLKKNEKTFYCKRVRFLDETPVGITETHVPIKIAPTISVNDFSETEMAQSLHYVLEKKHDLHILKWVESLEAVIITEENANILKVQVGSPGILRNDILYSVDGKIIACDETLMTNNYQIRGLVYLKERL
jgi:GntR family transcriptional regulator